MDDLGQAYQLEYRGSSFIRTAVSPKEAVDEILRSMWIQADKKNIKLLSQVSGNLPDIDGDYLSIQRIFHNLINNAVKISPQNGIVRISGSETETKNGRKMVSFQIQDSGPGISQANMDHIFDPFFTTKKEGTGLGLPISYRIIQQHDGDIEIESTTAEQNPESPGTKRACAVPPGPPRATRRARLRSPYDAAPAPSPPCDS